MYKESCNYMDRPDLNRQSSKCTASVGVGGGGVESKGLKSAPLQSRREVEIVKKDEGDF